MSKSKKGEKIKGSASTCYNGIQPTTKHERGMPYGKYFNTERANRQVLFFNASGFFDKCAAAEDTGNHIVQLYQREQRQINGVCRGFSGSSDNLRTFSVERQMELSGSCENTGTGKSTYRFVLERKNSERYGIYSGSDI